MKDTVYFECFGLGVLIYEELRPNTLESGSASIPYHSDLKGKSERIDNIHETFQMRSEDICF